MTDFTKKGIVDCCKKCGMFVPNGTWYACRNLNCPHCHSSPHGGAQCAHCGGDIAIRNPKGFCDHLYYPDNCEICSKKEEERLNSKNLTARIEEVMEKYSLYYDSETVTVQPKFLVPKIAALFAQETKPQSGPWEKEWEAISACLSDPDIDHQDIIIFKEAAAKLIERQSSDLKTRILERLPKEKMVILAEDCGDCANVPTKFCRHTMGWNDTLEEVRKIIEDL